MACNGCKVSHHHWQEPDMKGVEKALKTGGQSHRAESVWVWQPCLQEQGESDGGDGEEKKDGEDRDTHQANLSFLLSGGWRELKTLQEQTKPCPQTVLALNLDVIEPDSCSDQPRPSSLERQREIDPGTLKLYEAYLSSKRATGSCSKLCRDTLIGNLHSIYAVQPHELCHMFCLGR